MNTNVNTAAATTQASPSNGERKIKCTVKNAAYYLKLKRRLKAQAISQLKRQLIQPYDVSREEHVNVMGMPYTILIFRTANDGHDSLFEEEPSEVYFKHIADAKWSFNELVANSVASVTCSHLVLMKYGMGGEPEDGDTLDEWDEADRDLQ